MNPPSTMRPIYLLISSLAVTATLILATPHKTRQLLAAGKEPVRIVCIGDSITGVYFHTGGLRAYPEMLEIALQKIYPQAQVTVRNAGISGDTTKGALARLDRDVLTHKPHLVTVMFGMNDMANGRSISLSTRSRREESAREGDGPCAYRGASLSQSRWSGGFPQALLLDHELLAELRSAAMGRRGGVTATWDTKTYRQRAPPRRLRPPPNRCAGFTHDRGSTRRQEAIARVARRMAHRAHAANNEVSRNLASFANRHIQP
jgi:lysophospholipase L1-like esterase